MADVVVSVRDLRSALDAVLTAVEREQGDAIALPADHYWALDRQARYDLQAPAPVATIGQVSDDAASLRAFVADGEYEPLWHVVGHAIGLLGALDHAIGDVMVLPSGSAQ